ncbi:MAG: DHA2 family efflux MFS transporter permease subunit [Pleurocapsa minor GSE-CHR-MK-17-07R]|jgi:EmrB/QacA subfamily drug resistance transporter|nr:DHA2 family efflux MFS transporter permease subunit [Pleurocapsa minor GSE-CHR-MK 17-07R]
MSSSVTAAPRAGLFVMLSTILASSMAFIDGTALGVAMPALQNDLGATAIQLSWIVNGYTLMLSALILVGGALGDRYGRNRVFGLGIILFTVASVLCALAPTADLLIIARVVQGLGGALMVPGSLAIIAANFPPNARGRAIGTWSTLSTLTTILGPVIGGVLASNGLWRGVFLLNIPLAVIALVALARVPETRDENATGTLDYPGAALVTLGLAALTFGLSGGGTLVTILGVVFLVAFVGWELRAPHPMMPVNLFRSRTFAGTNLLTFFLYGALYGVLFFLPLNLIQIQGYDAQAAGLVNLPFGLLLAIISRFSGAWVDRVGAKIPLVVGPAITGIGFVLLGLQGLTGGPAAYWTTFFPTVLVLGVGMGITIAPLTTAVMGSAPATMSGAASGINNAISRSAGVIAIALFSTLAVSVYASGFAAQTAPAGVAPETMTYLTDNADRLADLTPPDGMAEAESAATMQVIRENFVDTFQVIALVSAALAFLSAAAAFVLVDGKKPTGSPRPAPITAEA